MAELDRYWTLGELVDELGTSRWIIWAATKRLGIEPELRVARTPLWGPAAADRIMREVRRKQEVQSRRRATKGAA